MTHHSQVVTDLAQHVNEQLDGGLKRACALLDDDSERFALIFLVCLHCIGAAAGSLSGEAEANGGPALDMPTAVNAVMAYAQQLQKEAEHG